MFAKKSPVRLLLWTALAAMILGFAAWTGCSKSGSDEDLVLADVGSSHVMASEYKRRLAKQEESDLPRGDDGQPLDMSSLEGKRAFLEVLINKELMRLKALQLGYMKDPKVAAAKKSLEDYNAGAILWEDVVGTPSKTISEEELQAFYANMGKIRHCHYLITNFKEDAEAARRMALDGADWDDVVAEYHDGDAPPGGGDYVIDVPFGQYGTDFETPVFATEVGGITEPILTVYGWWVLRVDKESQGEKPDLEQAKAKILDTTLNRKISRIKNDFRKEIEAKYQFTINEDALWKCYQGLPEGEVLLDPETNKPTPRSELKPLDIKPEDMDLPFYSYVVNGKKTEYTLGDYKAIFDRMSVFQRPKKNEMLGSLRNKIRSELDKTLLNLETEDRGLKQDPRVTSLVNEKLEEILVTKIYKDLVKYDEEVTPEQLQAFWDEHQDEYRMPERRSGHMVVCRNEEDALAARSEIEKGTPWRKILVTYGTDATNKSKAGRLTDVANNPSQPALAALFALDVDQISDPVALGDGRYAVVKCETVTPGRPADLAESSEAIGKRIRKMREEEAFQKLLADWREEFGVTIYDENLAKMPSWQELTNPPLPGKPVPRNA